MMEQNLISLTHTLTDDGTYVVRRDVNSGSKSRDEYPYSYDSYEVYRNGKDADADGSAYTDRIWQWDNKISDSLWENHAGKGNNPHDLRYVPPKVMEAFLRERFNNPILTIVMMQDGCNASTGYPIGYVTWNSGS